jgi:S-adenosylmethionine-diacylglycerol 3-amino-3-carboxypropyl transferase
MELKKIIKQLEFEARIFVSFSIVIITSLISIFFFRNYEKNFETIFRIINAEEYSSLIYLFAAVCFVFISLLRMWAGSLLSSKTVMSFKVQSGSLIIAGPYQLVRNPIYFSDLLALTIFSLFLPVSGLIMPMLFYIHYIQLIKYEEESFCKNQSRDYKDYLKTIPRLIPSPKSIFGFIRQKPKVHLNKDGIRHNALFVLFVPGFLVGYLTDSFLYTALIGIPAVIDWAIVHTKIGLPKNSLSKKKPGKVFNDVLYSQCWEDPQMDRTAFNIQEDDVIFSITSGGCNLLTFLIDNPKSVIALDLNRFQNYLLELKMAAFKYLTYENLLRFLGVRQYKRRTELYNIIKSELSEEARIYWDQNLKKISKRIIHCGRYEKYMKLLRNWLNLLIGKRIIKKFFEIDDSFERKELFDHKWNNWRWKLLTKILLSRKTMSLLFDKAFFKYLKENFSFGDNFAEKTRRALTELPVKENYFLRYILFGNFDERFLSYYLRRENYELIRSRLDRIKIVTDSCDNYFKSLSADSISKFNFTNIFEWISEEAFEDLLRETSRVAINGAVITYRNLLVHREHPTRLSNIIESDKILAEQLHKNDLAFIYDNYVVERIIKDEEKCLTELLKYQHEES